MNERLLLASPSRNSDTSCDYLSTGEKLTDYLLHSKRLFPEQHLKHLSLNSYRPFIDNLYVHYKNVCVMDPNESLLALVGKELWKRQHPEIIAAFGDEIRELEESFAQKLSKQDAGERASVIYKENGSETSKMTDPIFGEYTSVLGPRFSDLRSQGHVPILDEHTHPNDALPSPNDYYPILRGDTKGILVLCPNCQIMALPTSLTPLMFSTRASVLTDYWKKKGSGRGDDEGPDLVSKIREIDKKYGQGCDEKWREISLLTSKVQNSSRLPRRERRQLARDIQASERRFNSYRQKYNKELQNANKAFSIFINTTELEYSRLLNVVLYISWNRDDFYKFSA